MSSCGRHFAESGAHVIEVDVVDQGRAKIILCKHKLKREVGEADDSAILSALPAASDSCPQCASLGTAKPSNPEL